MPHSLSPVPSPSELLAAEAPSGSRKVSVRLNERVEGVDTGTLAFIGTDPDRIVSIADRLLCDPLAYAAMSEAANPYGDGRAAERIVAALEYLHAGGAAPAPFGSSLDRRAVLSASGHVEAELLELPHVLAPLEAPIAVREAS